MATDAHAVGAQVVLDILEARRFKQPTAYAPRYSPSDGQLNAMVAAMREHDASANVPIQIVTDKDRVFDNWLLGTCEREDGARDVFVTTDRVHASEARGDALDDAACWVYLRNNLPIVIAALEELLVRRMTDAKPAA